jgi:hypothetical protein
MKRQSTDSRQAKGNSCWGWVHDLQEKPQQQQHSDQRYERLRALPNGVIRAANETAVMAIASSPANAIAADARE